MRPLFYMEIRILNMERPPTPQTDERLHGVNIAAFTMHVCCCGMRLRNICHSYQSHALIGWLTTGLVELLSLLLLVGNILLDGHLL